MNQLIGYTARHVVTHIDKDGRSTEEWSLQVCPECGGTVRCSVSRSVSRQGGGSGWHESCLSCDYADADADGWTDEEAAYEDHCDAAYHRANPDARWADGLCHHCEGRQAQDGAMLCRSCEVELYGEEQAAAYREQRRLDTLPYRPVGDLA